MRESVGGGEAVRGRERGGRVEWAEGGGGKREKVGAASGWV